MNPNVWNIKEILSIPTGNSGAKITNRIGVTNGHSSLTDSQFVCGSQFWPENSQGMSQEMSFSSRTSQQSSQEGSEPKMSSNYHTKPFLFGGEGRDKVVQKAISILDTFEEDKKKAKEKSESDLLAKECLYFREMLNNMKHSVIDTERNTAVCKTILEGFDKFATTLQQNLSSLHNDIAQQFEIMLNKVNSQTQMLTDMEERVLKTGGASAEMGSHVQGLQKNLEALREEQGREKNMLQEALSLLSTLVYKHSTQPDPVRVTDSAVQTSPGLVQPFSSVQQNSQPEHSQVTLCQPEHSQVTLCQPEHSQLAVPSPDHWDSCITAESRATPRGRKRNRRRPLVPPQRSNGSIWDEHTQPQTKHIKQELATPLKQLHSLNRMASPKSDPRIGYNRESRSNQSTGNHITPFSMWSQDSCSSVCITGIEPSSKMLPTGSKIKITENTKGFWQLFDISCDSDPFPVEEE